VPPVACRPVTAKPRPCSWCRAATALAEFVYDGFKANYTAQLISKFATHLLANPDDTNARATRSSTWASARAQEPRRGDRAILIRDDGLAAVMHALRDDDVTGFMRWTTQGQFLSAAADLARDEYVATLRNGEVMLEKIDAAAMLDCQVTGGRADRLSPRPGSPA
jgi:hypothetical protein